VKPAPAERSRREAAPAQVRPRAAAPEPRQAAPAVRPQAEPRRAERAERRQPQAAPQRERVAPPDSSAGDAPKREAPRKQRQKRNEAN
jgi:hypothetical protein